MKFHRHRWRQLYRHGAHFDDYRRQRFETWVDEICDSCGDNRRVQHPSTEAEIDLIMGALEHVTKVTRPAIGPTEIGGATR